MQKQPSSRYCFLCGKENPVGLGMEWKNDLENDRVIAHVRVPDHFNGFPGVVHGGIVAAILDEITYNCPTPTETELTATAWAERQTARRALVKGELKTPDNRVTATCQAVIIKPPSSVQDAWQEEKKYWKVYD